MPNMPAGCHPGHDCRMTSTSTSRWSLWSEESFLCIASRGSVLSIASIGSVLSIGSVGSALSIGAVGSVLSWASVMSARSGMAVLSHRSRRAVMTSATGRVRRRRHTRHVTMEPLPDAAGRNGAYRGPESRRTHPGIYTVQ